MKMLKRKWQYYFVGIINILKGFYFNIYNKIHFKFWGVKIRTNVTVFGTIKIVNMNKITIHENTRISSGYSNMVGGECKTCFYTGQNGEIVIGKNVGISNSVFISQDSIIIGENVFIGGGCKFYDNDFHSINFQERINSPTSFLSAPIQIHDGVFIGGHSIVLKGVSIGEYSVIGAGSVVTKNVPAGELWAGVPARKIRVL